jgi:hypothetical protein
VQEAEKPHSSGVATVGIAYGCSRETEDGLLRGSHIGHLGRGEIAVAVAGAVADTAVDQVGSLVAEAQLAVAGHCKLVDMAVRQQSSCIVLKVRETLHAGMVRQVVLGSSQESARKAEKAVDGAQVSDRPQVW